MIASRTNRKEVRLLKKIVICFLLLNLALPCLSQEDGENQYNSLGGWMDRSATPRQFFYVEKIDNIWWFVDPGGKVFLSKGVNHISYTADYAPTLHTSPYGDATRQKYGSQSAWAKETAGRLRRWGFNTIGAWSNEIMRRQEIPYTLILNIAESAGGNWEKGIFPDVYSNEFKREARRIAQTQCAQRKDDIYLLGYFTDNELRWGPDWRSKDSLLISYLKLKADTGGHREAIQFLNDRYKSIAEFNAAWKLTLKNFGGLTGNIEFPESESRSKDEAAFQEQIARQYFSVCREAIHKYDPNHLILGCRFAGYAPQPVLRGMKDSVDVISYNTYNPLPPKERLQEIHNITGKPLIIGEFSFKAMDSGLPNTKGAGKPVPAQIDRAQCFSTFVTELMQLPFAIGYHWFEYADEPAEGRFDGENSNYGLVNIADEPWKILTDEMTRINRRIEKTHARAHF